MRRFIALPDQTTRVARNRMSLALEGAFGLFAEGDAPAGGGAAPAAPAAAAPAAPAPAAAPAAAAPVAAAPAEPAKPAKSVVGGAEAAPAAAAAPTADEQKAFLIEKGAKAEDLAKLDEAGLKKAFDEKKAEKPADPAKPVKAEDIKITVPEGITIDEKQMGELKGILADASLTPEQRGQKLVDMHVAALKSAAEQPRLLWEQKQQEWQTEIKADKEIGGANYDAQQAAIGKLIDELGGKEAASIREAFDWTGVGNVPQVVRLLYRAAKAILEPTTHASGGKPSAEGAKNPATTLYPNQNAVKLANAAA